MALNRQEKDRFLLYVVAANSGVNVLDQYRPPGIYVTRKEALDPFLEQFLAERRIALNARQDRFVEVPCQGHGFQVSPCFRMMPDQPRRKPGTLRTRRRRRVGIRSPEFGVSGGVPVSCWQTVDSKTPTPRLLRFLKSTFYRKDR